MTSHCGVRKNVGPVLCVIDRLTLRGQTQNSLKNSRINQTPRFCRMQSVFLGLCDKDIDVHRNCHLFPCIYQSQSCETGPRNWFWSTGCRQKWHISLWQAPSPLASVTKEACVPGDGNWSCTSQPGSWVTEWSRRNKRLQYSPPTRRLFFAAVEPRLTNTTDMLH